MTDSHDPSAGVAFAQLTHPGLLRKVNQDCSGASPAQGVFLVCDGMGGAAAGEVASQLAVATFLSHFEAVSCAEPPHHRLHQAILAANTTVFRQAYESSGQEGMGTTLVAAHIELTNPSSQITIAHVGDSRCYLLRERTLTLLTGDHSIVEEQVRAGFLTRQEADVSSVRHVITRAIGSNSRVEPEIQSVPVCAGDLLLLASDGLNRELTDDEIGRILSAVPPYPGQQELEAACRELVACANARGGRDNVTVLLLAIP